MAMRRDVADLRSVTGNTVERKGASRGKREKRDGGEQ
jgi:hypothetical protein